MLYNWDAVQFALALNEYDVVKHQPHPPGYILYVALGRLVNHWLADPTAAYVVLAVVVQRADDVRRVLPRARGLRSRDRARRGHAARREPALLVLRLGRADVRGRGARRVGGGLLLLPRAARQRDRRVARRRLSRPRRRPAAVRAPPAVPALARRHGVRAAPAADRRRRARRHRGRGRSRGSCR